MDDRKNEVGKRKNFERTITVYESLEPHAHVHTYISIEHTSKILYTK